MVEILKQKQYQPMDVVDEVLIIYAGTKGYLDKVPIRQVQDWETQFLRFMHEQRPEVRNTLAKERKISPALEQQINDAIKAFQPQFRV
jgi:F-type H+-transporting ATPase subunit alpha